MPQAPLTDDQCIEVLRVYHSHDTPQAAADALGLNVNTFKSRLRIARSREDMLAVRGWAPAADMTHVVPFAYAVKGVSTYYGEDGKPRGQWVKTKLDDERRATMIRDAFEAMATTLPRLEPIAAPALTNALLCNVYTITDFHMGMLAWRHEGGADWDLKIAERTLTGCFQQMVRGAPDADTCVIAQLGDFLHIDGLAPVTPSSGHILDADGRFRKIVERTLRALRATIDFALTKHRRVIVLMAEGNHDIASAVWLQVMFRSLYENEPRVQVIDSALPYYAYQHGRTMLGWHHGHLSKNDSLPLLFATQFGEMWGSAKHRYFHTGHRHHQEVKEHNGAIVEQHQTLAARDAYAARGGWHAERGANAITYHTEFGEVGRNTVRPEMLEAA